MLNPNELKNTIDAMPIASKLDLFDALEESLFDDYDLLASQAVSVDAIVMEQRFADFKAGKTSARPWPEVLAELQAKLAS